MRAMSPATAQAAGDAALDGRALDALRREAARDPRTAVNKAAQQFEALFMQMVLKSMREATPKSGLLDSSAGEIYTGMLDQQLAGRVAAGGTGLADMIARQLTRHMRPAPAAAGDADLARAQPAAQAAPRRAAASSQPAEGRAPTGASRDFVATMWVNAVSAERATGLPAKFIIGQAALESGWGRREIRAADGTPSHNLFGIKAGASWKGRTVERWTTEYENGQAKRVLAKFRAYDSYAESFLDWARLMATQPRYAGVLADSRSSRDARVFAHGLQRAGYATDPEYGAKLTRVINTTLALRSAARDGGQADHA